MKTANTLHHKNAWEPSSATVSSLVVPSGSRTLDDMLPAGGWPKSGIVEIILADAYSEAMGLIMPALVRFSRQRRWLALVNPTYPARTGLFTEDAVRHERVLTVNPHPGRSALWTAESLLRAGECSVVMAWPNCSTELMGKRLERAAAHGKALGILFSYEGRQSHPSGVALRLKLESGGAVYLLNSQGEVLAGEVL